ncbi:DUF761 domain-containing protein/DUF4408 domain-containing protein [Cephalotus follicularis]|uniref:DUF761 domain-containing protein/DUF4408 domain-containing protein n=1 Tax=Cephalotus follicularis TaxID=3775 RepID=A0A1Q3CEE2_CEPFO|nr:DUF761 domain-containing protein/DUF4408 domain-containing protein [Cephalotus follicularis]
MFTFMSSWLTPTSLFLILNLVIGTIFITSRFTSHNRPQHDQHQLHRPPSLLDRVKSINFSLYKFPSTDMNHLQYPQPPEPEEPTNQVEPPLTRASFLLERVKSRVKSINLISSLYISNPPNPEPETHTAEPDPDPDHVKRTKSEMKPGPERIVIPKMKKSASEKSVMVGMEEEYVETVERRRPETVRTEKRTSLGDQGVDAKADDFINRFKQQLKLQRLDSLLRCK